jgi:hypothetical protein
LHIFYPKTLKELPVNWILYGFNGFIAGPLVTTPFKLKVAP